MDIKLPNNKLVKIAKISQKDLYGRVGGTLGLLAGATAAQYLAMKKGYKKMPAFIPGGLAGLAIGTIAGRKFSEEKKRRKARYASLVRDKIR